MILDSLTTNEFWFEINHYFVLYIQKLLRFEISRGQILKILFIDKYVSFISKGCTYSVV